jgi:hypothetical protein
MIKTASFLIQTVKFKFKRVTINQEVTPSYRPPTPATDDTVRTSSNAGGTARPGRPSLGRRYRPKAEGSAHH